MPSILNHNTTPTAYPPTRTKAYSPLNLYYAWINPEFDDKIYDIVRQSAARIQNGAIAEGQDIANAPLYPNYAIFGTPLKAMYGDNVDRLKLLRQRVDPLDVMGLTGFQVLVMFMVGISFCSIAETTLFPFHRPTWFFRSSKM